MKIHNPDDLPPKEWTYVPLKGHKQKPEKKWEWFKDEWAGPLGAIAGFSFCFCWPLLLIAALMFGAAPFTSWNPSRKDDA